MDISFPSLIFDNGSFGFGQLDSDYLRGHESYQDLGSGLLLRLRGRGFFFSLFFVALLLDRTIAVLSTSFLVRRDFFALLNNKLVSRAFIRKWEGRFQD